MSIVHWLHNMIHIIAHTNHNYVSIELEWCVYWGLPLHTLGLWRKRDSSICTTIPGPPNFNGWGRSFWEQTSLNHWYTLMAVSLPTSASSAALVTGYSLTHQYSNTIHFCSGNLLLLKKLPSLSALHFLQAGQRQTRPSLMSLFCPRFICVPHTQVLVDAKRFFPCR